MLGVAVALPAAAGAAAPVPGTGKPPAGSGINTAAALDNPHCDKTAGPYGRLDFVQKGTGPVCVTVWKEGKDNGGATYQGVTKDKIKVVALVPNEQQMAAVTPNQLPMNYPTGKPGTVQDVFERRVGGLRAHVRHGIHVRARHRAPVRDVDGRRRSGAAGGRDRGDRR